MEKKRKLILEGKMFKVLLFLAAPLALNEFLRAFNDLIDTLFNKQIGANALAVMGFVEINVNFIFAICTGITIAATALVARYIGKQNPEKAKKTITSALLIVSGLGAIIGLLCFVLADPLMVLLGGKGVNAGNSFNEVVLYFRIHALLLPIRFIAELYFVIRRAEGAMITSMIVSVVSMIIKVISAYVFVQVLDLGLIGLGLSTLVSTLVMVGALIYQMFIKKGPLQIKKNDFKIEKRLMTTLVLMSLPLILEKTLFSFSHVIINVHLGNYSDSVRGAYTITNKFNQFIFGMGTGFGMTLVTVVSQSFAAGKIKRAEKSIKMTFLLSISLTILLVGVLFLTRSSLIPILSNDPETISKTMDAMNIYSASAVAWSIIQIAVGLFQGSGHTKIPVILSFSRLFLFRLPVLFLLSVFAGFVKPEFSIWFCMLIANVLTAILAIILYFTVDWRKTPKLLVKRETEQTHEIQ